MGFILQNTVALAIVYIHVVLQNGVLLRSFITPLSTPLYSYMKQQIL